MNVVNKKMYHFHKKGFNDNLWIVNNGFNVSKTFSSNIFSDIKRIDKDASNIEQKIEYYKLLNTTSDKDYIREVMLELFRQLYYPDIVSRLNCMYFCDEKSLLYWSNMFFNNFDLYEVLLTGKLFKSSSKFLPSMDECYTFDKFKELSDIYWNPNFSDFNQNYFAEYLFQGHVRVKEKLDPDCIRNKYN